MDSKIQKLLALYKEVMGIDFTEDDNFFVMGGNSVSASKLLMGIYKTFGADIELYYVYEYATPALMMELIEKMTAQNTAENVVALPTKAPLSYAQTGVWYESILEHNERYTLCTCTEIRGILDKERFSAAVERALEKYDILKSRILTDGNFDPYQKVFEDNDIPVNYITVDSEEDLKEFFRQEAVKVIPIEGEKLAELDLISYGEEKHYFITKTHHIITDDRSAKIFAHEVKRCYLEGEKPLHTNTVSEKTGRFYDYCINEKNNEVLTSEEKEKFRKLIDKSSFLQLPGERIADRSCIDGQGSEQIIFNAEKLSMLRRICAKANATLYHGFMALFIMFLSEITGEKAISIGTPFSQRSKEDFDVMGLMVNLEVIHIDLNAFKNFQEIAAEIKRITVNYLDRKYIPFSEIVRMMNAPREKMYLPFHILYNYLENESIEKSEKQPQFGKTDHINISVNQDIGFLVKVYGDVAECAFTYSVSYMDADTICRYRERFIEFADKILSGEENR